MAVRFKFRSSVDFDSVDIEGRPFISVRDLRSKIVEQKHLQICQDFDLVISNSDTGDVYYDESFLVPSGSSVIIKRIPAGRSAPSILPSIDSVENCIAKHSNFIWSSPSATVDVDNFDDFGIDLYPVPEPALSDSDPDDDRMNCLGGQKADNAVQRSSEPSFARFQNFVPGDLSEVIPRGVIHCGIEGNASQTKLKHKLEENKLDEAVKATSLALPIADLPSELRCSLCNAIFKEAVMIPCCQHSFCDRCIHVVLIENKRCPKCSSTKCRVEDLLPNVSLRQAIEHFLESQRLISGSDNILSKYVPDGESGIHAEEVSCAVSILQRGPVLPHSPSTTGKGSNQFMAESACESLIRSNASAAGSGSQIIYLGAGKSVKSASSLHKIKQINGEREAPGCPVNFRSGQEGVKSVAEFRGENVPLKLPQTLTQEEANTTNKKRKGLGINIADGNGSFMVTSRHRKGDRTCYMCGSPDHFIRDCPAASSPHPLLQSGDAVFPGSMSTYGPPYWHGSSLPHCRPFANIYGNPGLMPFDPTMVPVTPYAISSYLPSIYARLPVPCGLVGMGGLVPPVMTRVECPYSRAEFMELRDCEQRRMHLAECQQREQSHDGDDLDECCHYNQSERSLECKPLPDRDNDGSYSEDTITRRSQKKHPYDKRPDADIHSVDWRHEKGFHSIAARRDYRPYHSDTSSSEIHNVSDSPNWHSNKRHQHHRSSKKLTERRGQCGSGSSQRSHHGSQKERDSDRQRVETDVKRHSWKHDSHSESGLEPTSTGAQKRRRKERESSHISMHFKQKVKSTDNQISHDRWEMVDGLDVVHKEHYHRHKHNRIR